MGGRERWRGDHGLTVGGRLSALAAARGDDAFVVTETGAHTTLTYGEMDREARRMAGLLASLGVGRGDAVHVQLRNAPVFLTCLFGTAHLGAVLVPTNPAATVDDIAYVTSHASCAVSIVAAEHVPVVLAAREMAPDIGHVLVVDGPADGAIDLGPALAAAPERTVDVAESDVAAVLYTSGTTGWPKGVMITHANLLFAGDAVASYLRVRPDDRWLVTLPLFHMNALGYSTMSALSAGASVALVERFDPSTWARSARVLDASLASLFAVHVRQVLGSPAADDDAANRLRFAMFAQHLTPGERDTFRSRFGATPLQVYGLTETIAPTLGDPPYGDHRPETVGRSMLWAPSKVVDRSGRQLPVGVAGELRVGGEPGRTLMAGYYHRPEETALVVRGGWLRTGDRFVLEADGSYRFLGRAAEVIKPGVDNVSAPEIERILYEHVAVTDAAVVGVSNTSGEESIVAFIVLRPDDDDVTAEEILLWARERLADYKVPHRVQVIDSLPRNAVGKVLKRELQLMG